MSKPSQTPPEPPPAERVVAEQADFPAPGSPTGPWDGRGFELHMLGHAHIDLGYRWDLEETVHRIAPWTFRGVLRVMEDTPGFTFCQSQLFLYHAMQQEYPDIFARIRERIREGRWEVVGGAWSEYDAILPSGESIIRQHLHGMRYAEDELGVEANAIGFIPDSFIGHAATLPQILRGCGIRLYLFGRGLPTGSPRAFRWIGPDGSAVIGYVPFGPYSNQPLTEEYLERLKPFREAAVGTCDLALYGTGDHGGGPREQDLRALQDLKALPNAPAWRYGTAHGFLSAAFDEAAVAALSEHRGGLRAFARGALTSQAQTKRGNRLNEHLLLITETITTLATINERKPAYPRINMMQLWRRLLMLQFHDILPGTSCARVYRFCAEEYRDIRQKAQELIHDSLIRIGSRIDTRGPEEEHPLLLFNTAQHTRRGVARLPLPAGLTTVNPREGWSLVGEDGRSPRWCVCGTDLLVRAKVPGIGHRLLRLRPLRLRPPQAQPPQPVPSPVTFGDGMLRNERFSIHFDPDTGNIAEIRDRRTMAVVAGRCFTLELHEEHERATSWVHVFTGTRRSIRLVEPPHVSESSDLHTSVRTVCAGRRSRFTRTVTLFAHDSDGAEGIGLRMETDWHDSSAFLKCGFDVGITNPCVTSSIAHGYEVVDSPGEEFCCHDWIHLGDGARGVVLANDGAYGADMDGSVLRMSVIRNARDMDPAMSWGTHELRMILAPTSGPFSQTAARHAAVPLARPILARWENEHPGGLESWGAIDTSKPLEPRAGFVSVEPETVELCAFKMLEEHYTPDGFVVRVRELEGQPTDCEITLPLACAQAWRADHLERPTEQLEGQSGRTLRLALRPYEIATVVAYLGPTTPSAAIPDHAAADPW